MNNGAPPRLAAQYVRVSTDTQRYSSLNQQLTIAAFAAAHGYCIVQTYEDENRSGLTTKGRGGLSNLLSDVVSGRAQYDTVLVLDVGRWGRYQDPDEAAHYEFLCRSSGVEVRYCAEDFDRGLAGSIIKQLKRVMAGEYSRELSAKVRQAKINGRPLGLVQGGACPYGVARAELLPDGTLGRVLARGERKSRPEYSLRYVPGDPAEIAIVRRVFALYLKGKKSPSAIARQLNADGLRFCENSAWTFQHVRRLLRCELLTGKVFYGKSSRDLNGKRVLYPRDAWSGTKVFDPIISEAMFKAAERRREWVHLHRRRSDERLLNDLRCVRARYGRISTALIDSMPECSNASYYDKRFGSLGAALALIGEPPRLNRLGASLGRAIPVEHLVEALRILEREHGYVSCDVIQAASNAPSVQTYLGRFGSMKAAYAAAGVRDCGRMGERYARQ